MKEVENIISEICNSSKIQFSVIINDNVYSTLDFDKLQKTVKKEFEIEYIKCYIETYVAFSSNLDLLIFCIKDKLKSIFKEKEEVIKSILDGEEISTCKIEKLFKSLNDIYLIDIYVDSNIEEIYSYISEVYFNSYIIIIKYDEKIILLGNLEEYLEHIKSIKETIEDLSKGKLYISYTKIIDLQGIRKSYIETKNKIELANKYKVNTIILDKKSLIFEEVINSVSQINKNEIKSDFNEGFLKLDNEMIKTIEIFFKCGLNLSDAARELYIHRNTLIYRIEKIQKWTSYDIRNFNDAVLFKIIFAIWKESKI